MGDKRTIAKHGAVVLACLGFLAFVAFSFGSPPPGPTTEVRVNVPDIIDQPSLRVTGATFTPLLVHWGTNIPFTGNGLPGVDVHVNGAGSVLNWTLEAWANETSPAAVPICGSTGVHFAPENWLAQSDGSQGGSATYVSTPEVSQRSLPGGDQCLARALAIEVWEVHLCINEGGLPRFHYRDGAGLPHYDGWDFCKDYYFRVPTSVLA